MPATATASARTKVDLYKEHAAEYATPRKPVLLNIAPARYLAIEGQGAPGGPEFSAAIGALYNVAFTMKMTNKFAGGQDYAVCKLEGQYLTDQVGGTLCNTPIGDWRWRLMIRTPDFMGSRELKAAVAALIAKKKTVPVDRVKLETIREGTCVQMLHVGPYDREAESFSAMAAFAESEGYGFSGQAHEIYLSDPRRVPAERLRTILRMPVRKNNGR